MGPAVRPAGVAGLIEEKAASSKATGLHHKRQPFGQGRQGGLLPNKVRSMAWGSLKCLGLKFRWRKIFFCDGKAPYKAKSSI